jgi:predicted RNase H-like HicB family nuclease
MNMAYRVNIIFNRDKDGYYVFCPDLPGCQSQGDTFEEARGNIKEAVELYLETMEKDEIEEALGKEILTTTMEVEIG